MTPHPDSPGASPRSVTTRAEIGSAPSRRSDRPTAGTSVQHRDALVVGGGIAGLTAAWELTRAGLRPLVVEARGYTGGLVAAGVLAGVRVDLGAEGFAVRGDAVTSMVDALGLEIVGPAGGGAGLFLPAGGDCTASSATPSSGSPPAPSPTTSSPSSAQRPPSGPPETLAWEMPALAPATRRTWRPSYARAWATARSTAS